MQKKHEPPVEMPEGEMMPGGRERPITATGPDQMPGELEQEFARGKPLRFDKRTAE